MSLGNGKLQWRLLTILTEHERSPASHTSRFSRGLNALTLAQRAHGREPTPSELSSVRQTSTKLRRAGAVRNFMSYGHRHYWVRVTKSSLAE